MQIIIVQAEIETAIRNHILSQIVIKEGMEITVDLRATRGTDGFQATIDIMPIVDKPAAKPVVRRKAVETAAQTDTAPAEAQAPKTGPGQIGIPAVAQQDAPAVETDEEPTDEQLGESEALRQMDNAIAADRDPVQTTQTTSLFPKPQVPAQAAQQPQETVQVDPAPAVAEQPAEASQAAPQALGTTAAPKKLFGNLTKPVN